MSDKLLDERDVLMKKVAVQQMKNKKLQEFKRKTLKKLLMERKSTELDKGSIKYDTESTNIS